MENGVAKDHILEVALDDRRNKKLRDPDIMLQFIDENIKDQEDYYIILDEVQYLDEFEDVLNSLLHIRNADVYVTGSNSKFLSSDVITQFRGRGDEIHVYPLSFSEYTSAHRGTIDEAWDDYLVYGGLPLILTMEALEDKAEYLTSLFQKVYISDIIERNHVRNKAELDELVDILASAIGSYTNQAKLARTFKSVKGKTINDKTIKINDLTRENDLLKQKIKRRNDIELAEEKQALLQEKQLERIQREADIDVYKLIININKFVEAQANYQNDNQIISTATKDAKDKLLQAIERTEKMFNQMKKEIGGEVTWVIN